MLSVRQMKECRDVPQCFSEKDPGWKKKKAQIVRNFLHVPLMLESCCDTLVWFSSMVRTQEA